ncbi:hypothetical protein B4V02_18945 [Paenibacillus kribbensis]|uniref:Integrase catalytic domain-containing protein n=1 Tax=Paenibacillus kribbensis TaxID=172713 RepID=A0A222WQ31_9BACL|nr:hypothetical protein B4V02_18945 [Paenibacillus kribbensis]
MCVVLQIARSTSLVSRAFATVKGDLRQIQWFHTDRGSEFKNQSKDELLETFHIGRSLSMKGYPYDNAAAEATFKVMKTGTTSIESMEPWGIMTSNEALKKAV